ncbi:hypothetical protein RJ639_010812 [Escallonia herrerae]|uniref:E2 ubiquitin-conjugating enzyme n=1 Tax=Escallonia herrerae TaxID=1293975 RepID=A0AA88VK14_9ASTE|nr:hypothetical protein RJ639_010812 [Escallonia herrerae]
MDFLLSDYDSFSESSDSEDQDDTEFMYGGQALCILSNLEETIVKIDDFLSFERGFKHWDTVRSIIDPSGQMGRVINVDMIVDLENIRGKKVKEVNSKSLQKIRTISVGDYVVEGPWIGKLEKIMDIVTVLFDDGTKCDFSSMSPEKLVPVSPDLLDDSQYPYYPGQRVLVELSSASKSARWLCGTKKDKRDEGTICAVNAGLVNVEWLGSVLTGNKRVPAPPNLQSPKNLTLLSCFSHASWQLGDWCLLPNLHHNDIMEKNFLAASTSRVRKGQKEPEKVIERSLSPNFQEIFVIVKTKTKVDVLWQDGSQSLGLDSNSLLPVNVVDAHDFWPEQFVLEKGTCDDAPVSGFQRWGVVKFVDARERTVRVNWNTCIVNQGTDIERATVEETVSAYELVEHPDYSYCPGDAVFKLQKGQVVDPADGRSYKNHKIKENCLGASIDRTIKDSGNEHTSNDYLSQIGIVLGFKDGEVKVKWATGLVTKVAPGEIFRVDNCESSFANPGLSAGTAEASNEETTESHNLSLVQRGKELLHIYRDGGECQNSPWGARAFSVSQAAIGFFTCLATSLFGSLGSTSLSSTSDDVSEKDKRLGIPREEEVLELSSMSVRLPLVAEDLQTCAKTISEQKVEETQDGKDLSSDNKYQQQFKRFDMVSDCSDHHFVDGAGKDITSSQMKRGWLKKVQQEWGILEKNLPETIYVRAYEERMDLLRAAVVGAPGTPYHDGLFFFDIFLPPDYPQEPPLVHYHSGGLRINPNLYESGKVCLSLLNTWTGTGSEVWDPESSTILQVLLSLQALVLNEKPYFNEAGYDEQMGRAEGEKNSVCYNENAFLLSCKTMMYLLRKPPKHFDALVEEHFSQRCEHILLACKAYMEGIAVGCASGHKNAKQEDSRPSSTGFKIMLVKLFPKLVEVFSDKGIDCCKFTEQGIECSELEVNSYTDIAVL